jgi:hypothetical protein
MASLSSFIFYILSFLALYVQVFFLVTFLENRKKITIRKGKVKLQNYPPVTIIVPCWNEETTIDKTVKSILDLNYPKDKLQVFLIDDGSTDNTWQALQKYQNTPNFKIFQKENGGKHTALNFGLERLETPYIGCLDADSVADLPDQYAEQFVSLRERLPAVSTLVKRAGGFIEFLSSFTGSSRPKRYLVLFSNSSELRPTGGFPGSYGLLTFENGRVKDFRADDIYNPDGQIQELIVPPLQLQHITPGWGMRDAAWWADYPLSAKKVMTYWQRGGGAAVDGVISIKPDMLAGILKITGPVSLPKYNMVLNADNMLAMLQAEVENTESAQPKQIIVDLAPLILQRLGSAPASQWAQLLALFKDGLDTRDILMYFDDESMQSFIASEGFDGSVQSVDGDYLMVNVSNNKGAKSDAVTDTAMKLESWLQDGAMVHRLTMTRRHNGGTSEYGFYNKPNHSWVRVLVPEGSVLRGITGNEIPAYRPLMDYAKEKAVRDSDVVALEATYSTDARGVTTFKESGKTGFGFWTSIEPGSTQTVQIEYAVPARFVSSDYHMYVQRQPGLDVSDFEFTLQKGSALPSIISEPKLTEWPDSWRLHDTLLRDLDISVRMK